MSNHRSAVAERLLAANIPVYWLVAGHVFDVDFSDDNGRNVSGIFVMKHRIFVIDDLPPQHVASRTYSSHTYRGFWRTAIPCSGSVLDYTARSRIGVIADAQDPSQIPGFVVGVAYTFDDAMAFQLDGTLPATQPNWVKSLPAVDMVPGHLSEVARPPL